MRHRQRDRVLAHLRVRARAYTPDAIRHAVNCGARTVEHGNLVDAETAALMVERGVFMVPKLATYDAMDRRGAELGLPDVSMQELESVLDAELRSIEICKEAGVRMGLGTDLLGATQEDQSREFLVRSEVLTPHEIITAATATNAEIVRAEGELGVIAEGVLPDILWSTATRSTTSGSCRIKGRICRSSCRAAASTRFVCRSTRAEWRSKTGWGHTGRNRHRRNLYRPRLLRLRREDGRGGCSADPQGRHHAAPLRGRRPRFLPQSLDRARGVTFFAHGTTVVINALLARQGAKTALTTTKGFRDVLEIAHGNRPDLFNFNFAKPRPFVPRYPGDPARGLSPQAGPRADYRGSGGVVEPPPGSAPAGCAGAGIIPPAPEHSSGPMLVPLSPARCLRRRRVDG